MAGVAPLVGGDGAHAGPAWLTVPFLLGRPAEPERLDEAVDTDELRSSSAPEPPLSGGCEPSRRDSILPGATPTDVLLRVLPEEEEGDDTGYRNRGVAPGTTRPACIALAFGLPKPYTTGRERDTPVGGRDWRRASRLTEGGVSQLHPGPCAGSCWSRQCRVLGVVDGAGLQSMVCTRLVGAALVIWSGSTDCGKVVEVRSSPASRGKMVGAAVFGPC